MLASLCLPVSALGTMSYDDLFNELKIIEEKYDVEFFELTESYDKGKVIEFKNSEEFEAFISGFIKNLNEQQKLSCKEEILKIGDINTRVNNGMYTWTWWAPLQGENLYHWRNINHSHSYDWLNDLPYWVDCWNISSYITGLILETDWTHVNGFYNITTGVNYNDTLTNTVTGYYTMLVSVYGFEIGTRINGTWGPQSLRIVP